MADAQPMIVMTAAEADRRALADAMAELKAKPLDKIVDGGKYLVGGVLVDANGKPLADEEEDEGAEAASESAGARKSASRRR